MSDIPHQASLPHLPLPQARLAGALARPRVIAIGCVIALTGLAWIALGVMAADINIWSAICQPVETEGGVGFLLTLAMWVAMSLAMMLPTAGPMIVTYSEIADTAAQKGEPVVSPLVLTFGYLTVWLGFACAAAVAQIAMTQLAWLDSGRAPAWLAGAVFVGAGVYQFSAIKHACLTVCQRPFPFFFANWTEDPRGVYRLGLRQGMACLGCCWALMLVMFGAGAMNIAWMALLGAIMTIEKMSATTRFSRAVGVVFVAIGLGLLAMALVR